MDEPAANHPMTEPGAVHLVVHGAVAEVRLDRPHKRNALSSHLITELGCRIREVAARSDVRVVLLRAAGDRVFSAGADTVEFASTASEDIRGTWTRSGQRVFAALSELPQTTIAVLGGSAFGGGLELALHCDFRIAASHIVVGLPEVTLGTTPGWSGLQRVVALAGTPAARMLALTGRGVDAQRAYEWGLIDIVTDTIEPAVEQLVDDVLSTGPIAQSIVKRLLSEPSNPGALIDSLAGAYTASAGETFHVSTPQGRTTT
ncbi:enoyl-CoA hydratase/isomerase family protein [Rhodococcoides fascians]|uniref:enoyl-CoA hydratase/isomerase family protein n=1 Tax=Rhodococcoides fascians TaxID=1828 RepID=UPI002E795D70|nr:enoyl-CoA hydratase/isomerase family protein [Rhodococcus fascians]